MHGMSEGKSAYLATCHDCQIRRSSYLLLSSLILRAVALRCSCDWLCAGCSSDFLLPQDFKHLRQLSAGLLSHISRPTDPRPILDVEGYMGESVRISTPSSSLLLRPSLSLGISAKFWGLWGIRVSGPFLAISAHCRAVMPRDSLAVHPNSCTPGAMQSPARPPILGELLPFSMASFLATQSSCPNPINRALIYYLQLQGRYSIGIHSKLASCSR
jgi:hypothetical protein